MTVILNFAICGKTVPLTAWHTAEMDSAQKIQIESIDEVLFLKNAYRSLSGAIFQLFVLTICLSHIFFLVCCQNRIITKITGGITNDRRDVYVKDQGQRSRSQRS